MSCCNIVKKDRNKSEKYLLELEKHFDEIVLKDKENYRLLTLRDKVDKANYDYVVWLELKISYGTSGGYNAKSDEDMLENVLEPLLDWLDLLKGFEKKSVPKQLSLFGGDTELEPMPNPPQGGNDKGWSSYHKKSNEVAKRNLKKQYGFFELFHPSYELYTGIDYRKFLPSKEEVRELYKQAILKGKDNPGRYDEFWWDYPKYIMEESGLSDFELISRLHSIRLFLLPYKKYGYVSPDLSYTGHKIKSGVSYRYYLDGTKLSTCGHHDNDTLALPSYDGLFDAEFLDWVRDTLGIPYKEPISDDEVLKKNLQHYMHRLIGADNMKGYDFKKKVNTFKDWKEFKKSIQKLIPKGNNGGGSGYSMDNFRGSISIDGKGHVCITQKIKNRLEMNRNVDGLEREKYDTDSVYVWNLFGDDIYKKTFELFNKKEIANQTSLFDFAV